MSRPGRGRAAPPADLGGSSPTSWPPGALDPGRVEADRIVATHPDGSVAETLPDDEAPSAPPAPGGQGTASTPPFQRRGAAEHGARASRFGYRRDDRHLLGAPTRWRAFASVHAGGALPVSDLEPYVLNVLDQGAAPFCFAGAVAQALRICDVRNGVQNPVLPSRLELVYFTHAIEGDVAAFDGAFISDTFQVIEQLGFASETAWPYSDRQDGNYKVRPPEDVLRLSFDQIQVSAERILSTGDQRLADVAAALSAGKPVVFGTDISNQFAANDLGPDYTVDVPAEADIDGGHAMIIVGRRADGRFRVLNDWSDGWGDGGFCNFTPGMVRWHATRELWAVDFRRGVAR